jgi:hypothetical protein
MPGQAHPLTEVLVPFTKTTTRALAASIALVAAGATVAAAAVFQLPILGFGHATVASASAVPARVVVVRRRVEPKVIVKVRYVDDIVHRRAPVETNAIGSSQMTAFQPEPVASVSAPMPTPAVPTTIARGPAMLRAPTKAPPTEDGYDAHKDDGPSPTGHSTETAHAPAPAVDQ